MVNPEGYLVDVNESMCRFPGYTRKELLGTKLARYIHPDDRELDTELFEQIYNKESPHF